MDVFDRIAAKKKKVDLSTKRVVVFDRGPWLPVALQLGRDFGNVDYYLTEEETHPSFMLDQIGKGYEEIHLVDDFWTAVHKADMVVFTGVYNGNFQKEVIRQGIPCFSAMGSEVLETVKSKMYKMLSKSGLPVPTYRGSLYGKKVMSQVLTMHNGCLKMRKTK